MTSVVELAGGPEQADNGHRVGQTVEAIMKRFLAVMALAGMAFAAPALAATTCLESRDIVSSNSKDGKVMVFKMRNGQTYVNHLQGSCPDLKFNGFVWVLRSGDTKVCERQQSLRTLQSGQVCMLGAFDPPTMGKPPVKGMN
jgi:hypothetical protein